MPRRSLRLLLLGMLLAASGAAQSAAQKPHAVRDLHYGEVLFHFYQQDYLNAITHLMAAQEQDLLRHHREESELLLGGLELSYGMLNQAEQRFNELLSMEADTALRNRVWHYIAKISYQRGMHRKADEALGEITASAGSDLQAETALLAANVRMSLGQNLEAADSLKNIKAPEGWAEYLAINRGIALLRAGDIDNGRKTLDALGKQNAQSDELRALRDRANLGLGYELLRSGEAHSALEYLNRVRLRGPFMQAAMLGAGWASASQENYQDALTPWLTLIKLASYDPPVQEAHLAVPYAFNQLGDHSRAIYYYDTAISYYDREQEELQRARASVASSAFPVLLNQSDNGDSGGWLKSNITLENVPAGRYLVDILAGNTFQELLKDYRDLGHLEALLRDWQEKIDIFYGMVDARREAYAQRAPVVRARLEKQEAEALGNRWQQLQAQYETQRSSGDPLALATTPELKSWHKLHNIQQRLASLPDTPRHQRMLEQANWLQGVLYWQIQSDYPDRAWNINKDLRVAGKAVGEIQRIEQRVATALATAQAGFSGYDSRIDGLRKRIATLIPAIQQSRAESIHQIRTLAVKELEIREQRLVSYRSQARYALARNYDQLARMQGSTP